MIKAFAKSLLLMITKADNPGPSYKNSDTSVVYLH